MKQRKSNIGVIETITPVITTKQSIVGTLGAEEWFSINGSPKIIYNVFVCNKENMAAEHKKMMLRIQNTPEPKGQKFHIGDIVKITENCSEALKWEELEKYKGKTGTIKYSFSQALGQAGYQTPETYSLMVGKRSVSWFSEDDLELI